MSLLLNLHEIGLEAILNCFLVDEEIRSKKNLTQSRCPQPLKKFLNEMKEEEQEQSLIEKLVVLNKDERL